MALVYVHCPECQSIDVVQYGTQANGTQRYQYRGTRAEEPGKARL
jgi:hypothetical protein